MNRRNLMAVMLAALLSVPGAMLFSGCKGSDTRESIDETVETVSGKEQVDQMNKMKRDIEKAGRMSTQRMERSLEEETPDNR